MLEVVASCVTGKGLDGIIVDASAIVFESSLCVTRTHFSPFSSILVLDTALIGLVAHGVLQRTVGGSSSISSAIVWVLPVPAAPKMSALISLAST